MAEPKGNYITLKKHLKGGKMTNDYIIMKGDDEFHPQWWPSLSVSISTSSHLFIYAAETFD